MPFRHACTFLVAFCLASTAHAQIRGVGSTFAANLYVGWNQSLQSQGVAALDYEPVGSGAGVRSAQDRRADFGASDRPLARNDLDGAGLAQFPTAIGGVVILANVPGIPTSSIVVDGTILAAIFQGEIRRWDAKEIKRLNPEIELPALAIVPVFRSEGSGTSYAFTSYLSKESAGFAKKVGPTSSLVVPGGRSGRTTAEVAKLVATVPGAVGYADYSYASELGMPSMKIRNAWGRDVPASHDSIQLAMRAADWEKILIDQDPTFDLDLTDASCPGCYPIATATFVLVPVKGRCANSARVLEFFEHAFLKGDDFAEKEGYVPLPSRAKSMIYVAMQRWYAQLEKSGVFRKAGRRSDNEAAVVLAVR